MITITLEATEETPALTINFEHSLVSLSKWESLHNKPFYDNEPKTAEEMGDYICFMAVGETPPNLIDRMTQSQLLLVSERINANTTATTFYDRPGPSKPSNEKMTSELIYYWMVSFRIPFYPAENWHLGRLLALIKIASIKQEKPQKMSAKDQQAHYARLNAERRAKSGTSG